MELCASRLWQCTAACSLLAESRTPPGGLSPVGVFVGLGFLKFNPRPEMLNLNSSKAARMNFKVFCLVNTVVYILDSLAILDGIRAFGFPSDSRYV